MSTKVAEQELNGSFGTLSPSSGHLHECEMETTELIERNTFRHLTDLIVIFNFNVTVNILII